VAGGYIQLANCTGGILLSGTGEQIRLRTIYRLSAKDHSGSHHAYSVLHFFDNISE